MYEPMAVRFDSTPRMSLSLSSIRSWREESSEEWEDCRASMLDCRSLTPGGKLKRKEKNGVLYEVRMAK